MNESAPKPRRRRLRRVFGILAAVLVLLALFLEFGLGPAVKHGAQTVGSALLGCDVAITNCHMRLLSGVVDMQGVVVGPPEGFDANLFEMDRLRVEFSPRSLFGSGPFLIHELVVTNALVTYELKGIDSNLSAVTDRLGGGDDDGKEDEEEEEEEDEKKDEGGKKVVIEHFAFVGASVRAAVWDGKGIKPPLPSIELNDVGKQSGGITALDATGQILGSVAGGVVTLVTDLGGAVAGAAADAASAAAGAAADAAGAAAGAVGDAAEAVGDAIGGLFGN